MDKNTLLVASVGIIALVVTVVIFVNGREKQNSVLMHSNAQSEINVSSDNSGLGNNNGISGVENIDYTIDMSEFKYSVQLIEGTPGQTLTIKLNSVSGSHDFVIDAFNVNSGIVNEGKSKTVKIVIPEDAKTGEYEFYCSVMNHRELGLVGVLRVK